MCDSGIQYSFKLVHMYMYSTHLCNISNYKHHNELKLYETMWYWLQCKLECKSCSKWGVKEVSYWKWRVSTATDIDEGDSGEERGSL